MTDRPNHRADAERLLTYAAEWAEEAGELSPEASERACLAYATVHALFAIHDALTAADPTPTNPLTVTHHWPPWTQPPLPDVDAADRYAANEAKQREAGADPYGPLTCLHEWVEDTCVGDTARHFICTECGTTRTEDRQ